MPGGTQEPRIWATDFLSLIQTRASAKCPALPVGARAGPMCVGAHVNVPPCEWRPVTDYLGEHGHLAQGQDSL